MKKQKKSSDLCQNKCHSEEYWNGFDFACDILEDSYALNHPHKYNIADCLKLKVNRLPKEKVRENKRSPFNCEYNLNELSHIAINFAISCENGYSKSFSEWMKGLDGDWRKVANKVNVKVGEN